MLIFEPSFIPNVFIPMVRVLFVCLGNICRSPMAEGLMIHHIAQAGLSDHIQVDSAGTSGWHIGERADSRMREKARQHGVDLPSRARQVTGQDFQEFDYILGMDNSNMRDLKALEDQTSQVHAQLFKMRHFDEQAPEGEVPDPYYGGAQGFDDVYQMLDRATQALLDLIVKEHHLIGK